MHNCSEFSVFEYLYRAAGNWKAWGQLLLKGGPRANQIELFCARLESGQFFIAEQLGIPTLQQKFWAQYGGPTLDDHPWHEFAGVRLATAEEISNDSRWGTMQSLSERANSIAVWDSFCR